MRAFLRIEAFLIAYNVLEGIAAVGLGIWTASIALVGFGLDSAIEVAAASVAVWRIRTELAGRDAGAAERRAHRWIGATFFALAAYVIYEAGSRLASGEAARPTGWGVLLACLSLAVMPPLGLWKLRLADRLSSRALRAEAMETLVCAYLSLALLLGLGLNMVAGLWWADPAAALAMVPLMVKEGWEGIRGEEGESVP